MTFNKNNSKSSRVFDETMVTSLLTSDIECDKEIKELNKIVFDLEKIYEDVKDYNETVSKMKEKDYSNKKIDIHEKIDKIPQTFKQINYSINKLENVNVSDNNLKKKIIDSIRNVNSRVKPKQDEFVRLLDSIVQKEKARADFSNMPVSEKEMERLQSIGSNNKQILRESDISIKDLQMNEQVVQAREKELLEVQKISSQIKEMAQFMNEKTQEQGKEIGKYLFNFKI